MNVPFQHPTHLTRWRIPTIRWQALINLVLMALLVATLVALPAPAGASPRVHDALLLLAETQPGQRVSVIVRHDGQPEQVAEVIRRSGGHVIRELGFINSIVADIPARDIIALGRAPGVEWISPDAPMVDRACTDCVSTSAESSSWSSTVGLKQLRSQGSALQGQGVTVAVLDSGVISHDDLRDSANVSRLRAAIPVLDNQVLNGGFEDRLNQWGVWSNYTSGSIVADSVTGLALRAPRRPSGGNKTGNYQRLSSYVVGETYTLSASGKIVGNGYCYDSDGSWVGVKGISSGQRWTSQLRVCDLDYFQQSLQFTVPDNTEYIEVYISNGDTANDLLVDNISITPARLSANDGAGVIVSSATQPATTVNVASEGGLDWVVWNGTAVVRKSGVPARIRSTAYYTDPRSTYSSTGTTYSWTGGTPTASSSTTTGTVFADVYNGLTITAPATTSYRTLRLYLTLRYTALASSAWIDDASSMPVYDSSISTSGNSGGLRRVVLTYTFKADTDARTFTVDLWNDIAIGGTPNLVLHAATLSDGSALPVSTMTTVADGVDQYGHGTLVAGLIGGDGRRGGGKIVGVAPRAGLVSVRVLNATGEATISDIVRGMEWVLRNKDRYNIRVLNMSLNSTVQESYHTSPLSAAAEILWINGITVVVSAGNNGGNGVLFPPANDPFVITVGSTDDKGTASLADDTIATFSARGATETGTSKPDILTPGVNLTSLRCSTCLFSRNYPNNVATGFTGADQYFRASGTSLSAAVVSGAAALVLQQNPSLTPDQVKFRLMSTSVRQFGASQPATLNVAAAVASTSMQSANTGLPISQLLFTGSEALGTDSARWGSARWGSARWGSARWGSNTMASSLRTSVTAMARWGSRGMPPQP